MSTSLNTRSPIRSLALSVYFKNKDFGMRNNEILSRASAFLLNVDPSTPSQSTGGNPNSSGVYNHLKESFIEKKENEIKDNYKYTPAGGASRETKDLGWLEFCPKEFRPITHVIASSHVISPWRWPQYYNQEWIQHVKPEHCSYTLDVFSPSKPNESLAKFALNPYPIHHPGNLDLSIIHLKDEEAALRHMKSLGVRMLQLRDLEKEFIYEEDLDFTGFYVSEEDTSRVDNYREKGGDDSDLDEEEKKNEEEDLRVFIPFHTKGKLLSGVANRLLSSTDIELPQGACGGPILDSDGRVCGVIEGIVPQNSDNKEFAGCGAFIPSPNVHEFISVAEEFMLKKIIPDGLYEKVKIFKEGRNKYEPDMNEYESNNKDGNDLESNNKDENDLEKLYENTWKNIDKKYTKEEAQMFRDTIKQETEEVMDIMNTKGGSLDDVIKEVRTRTLKKEYEKHMKNEESINASKNLSEHQAETNQKVLEENEKESSA